MVEAGVGVHRVKVGDIVSIPFNIACGCCVNCKERRTNLCLDVNPLKVSPFVAIAAINVCARVCAAAAHVVCGCVCCGCCVQIGGAYGYVDMGGWRGGQSEYNLVPFADFNCLVLPRDENVMRRMIDIAMLSDSQTTADWLQ